MGRHKKYPDAENNRCFLRRNPTSEEVGVETNRKSINLLADEFDISRLKVL